MTPEESQLLNGLFDRLRSAESNQQNKDREAERLIQNKVSQQPGAPYLLAQTVLVQEHALNNAQARIAQLERQVAAGGATSAQGQGTGSFLSGLFGSHSQPPPAAQSAPPPPPAYPSTINMPPSAGGGFLRTALAAAAGVAGGSLLMHGFENLLGNHAGMFGSSMGSGFAGSPGEITENRDVTNNYSTQGPGGDSGQQRGSDDLFNNGPANSGQDFQQTSADGGDYSQPPTDDVSSDGGDYSQPPTDEISSDGGGYSQPPTDDVSSDDTGYDQPPTDDDSSFDSGSGDDSSLV